MPGPSRQARTIRLPGREIAYLLSRSRRRTLALSVGTTGVRVNVPYWVTLKEIESFIHERADWLQQVLDRREAAQATRLADGSTVWYLGRALKLRCFPGLFEEVRRVRHELWVSGMAEATTELIADWLRQRAARVLPRRAARYGARLGRACEAGLMTGSSRWGSCTARGRIRLNWRLVGAPLWVIDYVAAHEAAHLVHLDHSPRFWALVEALHPRWREARDWLKDHGDKLMTGDTP